MTVEEGKQFKILVVDDNPKNIQVIGQMLKETNYSIGFAMGGQQALDILAKDTSFDLVLLDVSMPVLNGFDTCKIIRQNKVLKELPVIFVTALTGPESILQGFEVGGQDYVTKPFNSKELLSRVHTQLELKHGKDQLKNMNELLNQKVDEKTKDLQHAFDELNKLDKMKTNFLKMISREIQTPINSIVGTINLIKNQEQSSHIKSMLDTLSKSLSKLDDFAEKAMLSTKLSSYKPQLQDFNLKEMLQFALIELTDKIQAKGIEIENLFLEENIVLKAERDLIFKSLIYVLDNAIKYTPNQGKITISIKKIDSKIVCAITDGGNGFSPEVLKNVFEPYTADATDISGLSLFIVKQVMELSNGIINIQNTGSGACVELTFNQ